MPVSLPHQALPAPSFRSEDRSRRHLPFHTGLLHTQKAIVFLFGSKNSGFSKKMLAFLFLM
ncbi:MAG: hypothetical protein IJ600_09055 [Lachnospiraceae bacterium]|nr:hypothetical protein [Lachnospiraceae bacterium]